MKIQQTLGDATFTEPTTSTMTYEQFKIFKEWAERIEQRTQENTLVRSIDIIHDIAGILTNDEHFLPRL